VGSGTRRSVTGCATAVGAVVLVVVVPLLALAAAVVGVVATGTVAAPDPGGTEWRITPDPAAARAVELPPGMATLYQRAAATCAGLPWMVLAAIGTVESDNGMSHLPGVHSGANAAGAEGPMQFEPATFAEVDRPVPPGGVRPPSPYDMTDAVYAAARLLCRDGAAGGRAIAAAVFAYNHSERYVAQVFTVATSLGWTGGSS
jgi:hypothetical protein